MIDRPFFFKEVRDRLGPLNQIQVDGFNHILDEANRRNTNLLHQAYILATAWWETDREMQPIREKGSEAYLRSKPYYPWVGEGLVQVTWEVNAKKFGAKKPGDLLNWPLALRALFDGMEKGLFTGKRLDDYITPLKKDFFSARRIVNGVDHAQDISKLALIFLSALKPGDAAQSQNEGVAFMTTINTEDFAKAFMQAVPQHASEAKTAHAEMGLTAPQVSVSGICDAWPKIKAGINTATTFMRFIPGLGSTVPLIQALVTALDTTLMPVLCGTK